MILCYVARYIERRKINQLILILNELRLPKEEYNAITREFYRPPEEDLIVRAVQTKHRLIYPAQSQIHEYYGTYWRALNKDQIDSYITHELGRHATNNRITSIHKQLKIASLSSEEFNKRPLLNLKNGTLDLSPLFATKNETDLISAAPIFRAHAPEDMTDYCLDYEYDKAAKCPKWNQFLAEVTNNDNESMALLQQFAGYILYPDCRLQRCLCLVGDGANGKSVWINTIGRLFPQQGITNLELCDIGSQFHTIELRDSILNISSEINSNSVGSTSVFKSVVAGETVSDAKKYKDEVRFRTRAKLLFASNGLPRSNDTSFGFYRRFLFCRLPLRFVSSPQKSDERQCNPYLEEELADELPGILNWMLEGCKCLLISDRFTLPACHFKALDEFHVGNDYLIEFVRTAEIKELTPVDSLYRRYCDWAHRGNYPIVNKTDFARKFAAHIRTYRPDIEYYRTGSVRGYRPVSSTPTSA